MTKEIFTIILMIDYSVILLSAGIQRTLGPSYYRLYALFNKIRDKGKIVSAW
jgi:hypothetical protein